MDKHTKEQRHKNMQAVKAQGTNLENLVVNFLWQKGYRFRKNVKDLEGKPDIAIKKYKLVIFIDSCFWHKCPLHYKAPATNFEFWENKISKNQQRDDYVTNYYLAKKWNILRIWEHELKEDFDITLQKVINFIENSKTN
ncbi:MAG: very short patch repair endonuclease [Cyanobacteria bacterium SIG28]|nr:very short patch repair endonuclease [Cyanobacteria bacterium SIG28]